ncbi:hypothetical protein P4U90_21370 [Cytobacillus kochii]|uniref:hypothetical protein n=1 Tax=Cytobacillus kochii TaxID=859143 RepID=UPI002E23D060|nr:hypothetical protein [Cytobacillus kochii]
MKEISRVVGFIAGLISMIIWGMFTFFNPYSSDFVGIGTALLTFFLLALPALFIIIFIRVSNQFIMLIAVIWSLPCSLYFALTPGFFAIAGLAWLLYLISLILLTLHKKKYNSVNSI